MVDASAPMPEASMGMPRPVVPLRGKVRAGEVDDLYGTLVQDEGRLRTRSSHLL
jgi:hypothetical protein